MARSRYVIGIDLGTTNTVVSYIDTGERGPDGGPVIRLLPIPQLVAEREVRELASLPSFLYVPEPREIEAGLARVPWDPGSRAIAGAFARDRGALVPGRQVASAKSWLSHAGVDRTSDILPWGNDDPSIGFSPVEASARYLAHIRDTWNHSAAASDEFETIRFERQEIVVTVPASFDDEARELTVQAAFRARIENVTLLEEPLAAFYAWIVSYRNEVEERLEDGDLVLVCDVGGGTTDFSLVRARFDDGSIAFERTAVGQHLLLGGDNVDFALARRVEERLGMPRLTATQRNQLRQQCRVAKERLLSDPDTESVRITVLGGGGAVVGGALTAELTVDDVEEVLVTGFLPAVAADERPARVRGSGLREIGLPYAQDAAVTRHLAEFLARAGGGVLVEPSAVLFNGGFFTPEPARELVVETMAGWFDGRRPRVLVDEVAESAVAVGAAYYGLVRRGEGLRIGGGTARSYYLGIDAGASLPEGEVRAVYIVPQGTEEGEVLLLEERTFALLANRPVSFRLFSSTSRAGEGGEVVTLREDEVHHHAPLVTVLRYGRRSQHAELSVRITASVSELGTLELWCESTTTPHRWRLQFELQGGGDASTVDEQEERPRTVVPAAQIAEARRLIRSVFGGPEDHIRGEIVTPDGLPGRLEGALGHGKDGWPIAAARELAGELASLAEGRRKSARHEYRWLNLFGFCLRPGFGFEGDEERIEHAWSMLSAGLVFDHDVQCLVEREVFTQRIAGGLDPGRQQEVFERLRALLGVGEKSGSRRLNPQVEREAWRAIASLEHLPAPVRQRLGQELLSRIKAAPRNRSLPWALARIGGRVPFYGELKCVVSAKVVADWINALIEIPEPTHEIAFAVTQIGARTNDPARDVDDIVRQRAIARLAEAGFRDDKLLPLRRYVRPGARQAARVFGESLPEGLRLVK